jgi:Fur family transcriptional regulator, ferric uptake regulator
MAFPVANRGANNPFQSSTGDVGLKSLLEKKLVESGMRLTGQRKVIAQVLARATDHPDAEEVHRRTQVIDPGISLSTVYRTVARFEVAGIIEKHAFKDGRARYETGGRQHHDHFIDALSGKVLEFRSPEIEALQAEIARRHGFRIVDHKLDIYVLPLNDEADQPTAEL